MVQEIKLMWIISIRWLAYSGNQFGAQALVPGHRHKNGAVFRYWVPDISLICPVQCPSTMGTGTGTVPEFWDGYLR